MRTKFLAACLAGLVAPLGAAGVESVAATPSSLHVELSPGLSGGHRLVPLQVFEDYNGAATSQGWTATGAGQGVAFVSNQLEMTFSDPAPAAFDPHISNPQHVDASRLDTLSMRVKITGAPSPVPFAVYAFPVGGGAFGSLSTNVVPTGGYQDVVLDLSTMGANWSGLRTLRIDPANAVGYSGYSGAKIEFAWIAVTDGTTYTGNEIASPEILWDFRGPQSVWKGTPASTVSFERHLSGEDLAYQRLQLVNDATNALVGTAFYPGDIDWGQAQLEMHGWHAGGPGGALHLDGPHARMNFFQPASVSFDPYLATAERVAADASRKYLRMRARMSGTGSGNPVNFGVYGFPDAGGLGIASFSLTPDGTWQTTTLDLSTLSGGAWSGDLKLRVDVADGAPNASDFTGATLEVDWLAISTDPNYAGGTPGPSDILWDFGAVASRDFAFPVPGSIKGLQVQMPDDAVDLGVNWAGLNVRLEQLFGNADTGLTFWQVDGQAIPINGAYVAGLDETVRGLTEAGARVVFILTNGVPSSMPPGGSPLIHPDTDLANTPFGLGAFNTRTEQGVRHYRGALEFLADHYTHPDKPAGWAPDMVVGNELNSHWYWHNQGLASMQTVMEDYADALRVADAAMRKGHPEARAFVSLEHHWTTRFDTADKSFNGRDFLESLNAHIKSQGDFPWAVAFHPYPENLFDPEFWLDASATMDLDTARLTFKNVELLPAFLSRREMRHNNEPRVAYLTEQGFHTTTQSKQAAAYARSYVQISNTPGIDAYILHRHVDNEQEGGLTLGLWTVVPGSIFVPQSKKSSWTVFRDADTASWATTFAPYLSAAGLSSWEDAKPHRTAVDFQFNAAGDAEGWVAANQVSGVSVSGGAYSATATGGDPFITREKVYLAADTTNSIRVRMAASAGTAGQVFFKTQAENFWSADKAVTFPITGDSVMRDHEVDMRLNPKWVGQDIVALRLDPMNAAGTFSVDSIATPPGADYTWADAGDAQGWTAQNQVTGLAAANGALSGTATGSDPFLHRTGINLHPDEVATLRIRMATSAGTSVQVYFTTAAEPSWSEAKSVAVALEADGAMHTHELDMRANALWAGDRITGLRLDPMNAAGVFAIDLIEGLGREWTVLSSDDFEAGWGAYTDGGGDCSRYTGTTYAHQGAAAINIQDNSGAASAFSTTGTLDLSAPAYNELRVDFWFRAQSMETGEDFFLEYYNGSSWVLIRAWASGTHFTNGNFQQASASVLRSGHAFPTNAKIRFRCDASDNNDDVYVDEIVVRAR